MADQSGFTCALNEQMMVDSNKVKETMLRNILRSPRVRTENYSFSGVWLKPNKQNTKAVSEK